VTIAALTPVGLIHGHIQRTAGLGTRQILPRRGRGTARQV